MAIISFTVTVDDVEAALAFYDVIQVWRSPDQSGAPIPYTEITSIAPEPAIINGTVPGPWNLNATSLGVTLSGADLVSIVFSGTNPFDIKKVIDAINEVIPDLASEVPSDTNRIRLTSPITGTGSSIVLTGTAAAVLGLSTTKANGKDARMGLNATSTSYQYRDFDGSLSFWYKTRFYSTKTKAASTFSVPRQGAPTSSVTGSLTSVAKIRLADGGGSPIIGRRIIFVPIGVKTVDVGGGSIYAIMPSIDRLIVSTDETGYAQMTLIRGARYRVFFEGTTYHREFVVPNSTEFDLLTILSTASDVFSIVQVPPMPIRS